MPLTPEIMRETIKAVVVVQATPLNRDGSLDLEGLRANTKFLVERCAGKRLVLVPTGSTGEAYALTDAERLKTIQTVVDCAAGKVPVVAGTAAAGTERTIELSKAAESAGAVGQSLIYPVPAAPIQKADFSLKTFRHSPRRSPHAAAKIVVLEDNPNGFLARDDDFAQSAAADPQANKRRRPDVESRFMALPHRHQPKSG
jgi:hypothetical protein